MHQVHYCPNCSRPVAPAQRFCGHCGTCLSRIAQSLPGPSHLPINKPIPKRVQFFQDRPVPENFKGFTGSEQRQIQPVNNMVNQKKIIPAGKNARPLRNEIFRLLSSLMKKQDLNN